MKKEKDKKNSQNNELHDDYAICLTELDCMVASWDGLLNWCDTVDTRYNGSVDISECYISTQDSEITSE